MIYQNFVCICYKNQGLEITKGNKEEQGSRINSIILESIKGKTNLEKLIFYKNTRATSQFGLSPLQSVTAEMGSNTEVVKVTIRLHTLTHRLTHYTVIQLCTHGSVSSLLSGIPVDSLPVSHTYTHRDK